MQKIVYDNVLYTQLVNEEFIDVHSSKWSGFLTELNAYSKRYYTNPSKVG